MKVLITNAYSRYNCGDAAIVSCMIQEAQHVFNDPDIVVSTMDSVEPNERFDGKYELVSSPFFEAVYRSIFTLQRVICTVYVLIATMLWVGVHRVVKRTIKVPFSRELTRFLKAARDADLMLAAGGGYLQTDGSLRTAIGLLLHLHTFWIGKALGKPVCLYAQSIGPFSHPIHARIVRHILNRVDLVIAREDYTLEILRNIGVRSELVRRAGDVAFLFESPHRNLMRQYLLEHGLSDNLPIVCITARRCLPSDLQEQYETAIAIFADTLIESGYQVVLVPQCTSEVHNDDDRLVEARIHDKMSQSGNKVLVISDQFDHWHIKAIYEQAQFMVATRMHSAIFALTAKVPTMAIAYEFKTTGIMSDLGLGDWVLDVREVNPESLKTTFDHVKETAEHRMAELPIQLEKYMDDARRSIDYVKLLMQERSMGAQRIEEDGKIKMLNRWGRIQRAITAHYHALSLSIPRPLRVMAREVKSRGLTYLSTPRLLALISLCIKLDKRGAPGIIVEAGCALGGSSILMAAAKDTHRHMKVFDVFGLIPPPTERDGEDTRMRYHAIESGNAKGLGGRTYYGYVDNLYDRVKSSFDELGVPAEDNHVELIQGLVQDALELNDMVCLAHIDVDWYEPVMTCLKRIVPRLCPEGAIVLDDYYEWSGCKTACDEYFADKQDLFNFDSSYGSLIITKKV